MQESLARAALEQPDFWSVVGEIELRLLAAVAAQRLAEAHRPSLIGEFNDLKTRVPSRSMWDSVFSEARFTLEPYLGFADADEQGAARALLAMLADAAGAAVRPASASAALPPHERDTVTLAAAQQLELVEALAEAFKPQPLERRVMDPLQVPADARSAARTYRKRVAALVSWAIAAGQVGALLRAAAAANPNSQRLRSLNEVTGLVAPTGTMAEVTRSAPAASADVADDPRLLQVKRQVCVVQTRGGAKGGSGTGFLIGPDQVMTHSGFLSADPGKAGDAIRAGVTVVFDLDGPATARPSYLAQPEPVFVSPSGVVVLRLDRPAGREIAADAGTGSSARARGWLTPGSTERATRAVVIVQYVAGGPKLVVSIDRNGVALEEAGSIYYRNATEPGSSGAPCFR